MPIIKSAIKRNKQNKIRRDRNLATQSAHQKAKKKFIKAIEAKELEKASNMLSFLYKKLAMSAKKKVISKSKASRYMAQSAKTLKEAGGKMPVGSVVEKKESPVKAKSKPKPKKATAKTTSK